MNDLSVLSQLSNKSKTQQQTFISKLLAEKHNVTTDSLLWDLVEIATSASRPTPTGEIVDDYKTRLTATKLLLELTGDYTPSRASMNVSLWFWNLIYTNKENDWENIIQGE